MKPRADIPRAKREGLDLDLDAVCSAGAGSLGPDDHYRLKTYGVCAQRQDDLFMVRLRVTAGRLDAGQVDAVVHGAERFAGGWVHLTTRQNVELHSVRLEDVPALYRILGPAGLVGRSSCGHTVRNVVACPQAGVSADEPFDVTADAERLARLLVARSSALNVRLPSRVNIVLGGCTECGLEALTNDIGLVACVRDGVPGYQLWAGGSLGSAPRLSFLLRPFLDRREVWPAVWSIIDWFCTEGDVETVAKGRLKFLIEERGQAAFRQAFALRFAEALESEASQPDLDPVDVLVPAERERCLARAPRSGWRPGVTPERVPGRASVTVRVPLGDLLAGELRAMVVAAPDGYLYLTREQNVLLRSVPVERVDAVLAALDRLCLGHDGARGAVDVRVCPGLAFCSLAITASQPVGLAVERALAARPDLPRDFTVAVSGCPNSCTKHQTADVGLAGTKVKSEHGVGEGYQMFLGAELHAGQVGEAVLRLRDDEVVAAVVAACELWVSQRRPGERPGRTFRRLGLPVVAAALAGRLQAREVDRDVAA
jgi:sulfite reductase beta subunit-like hemoprotein